MRKKLCNEFSRGFSFCFFFIFTHSSLLSNVVVGVSFFLAVAHTDTQKHTDGKLYGKLIYFLMDSISCAAFLLKSIFDTIMSYFPLIMFYLFFFYTIEHTDAWASTGWRLFSCTTSLSSHSVNPAKDERKNFSWCYWFARNAVNEKKETLNFLIIKFILSAREGTWMIYSFCFMKSGSWTEIWFCGGNPINWLDRTLKKSHFSLDERETNINLIFFSFSFFWYFFGNFRAKIIRDHCIKIFFFYCSRATTNFKYFLHTVQTSAKVKKIFRSFQGRTPFWKTKKENSSFLVDVCLDVCICKINFHSELLHGSNFSRPSRCGFGAQLTRKSRENTEIFTPISYFSISAMRRAS